MLFGILDELPFFEICTIITYSVYYHNILGALPSTTIMKKSVKCKKCQGPIQISVLHTRYMFMVVMSRTIGYVSIWKVVLL